MRDRPRRRSNQYNNCIVDTIVYIMGTGLMAPAFVTFCAFIPEVCQPIIDELSDEVLMCPDTPEGWKQVARTFYNRTSRTLCHRAWGVAGPIA